MLWENLFKMEYKFKCNKCGNEFIICASFSTIISVNTNCPNCKSKKVRRVYAPLNFLFKDRVNKKDVGDG
jgi:putative FmdB family regulatory protein